MYTMIIADDDAMARETIREAIDWSSYGIDIIGEATQGAEALALCLEKSPDILFTDIMMPHMTGLEVALTLRERGSQAKIIIISGVQDFEYARTALEMSVEGYILKPIRIAEIAQVMKKILSTLKLERHRQDMMARLTVELGAQKALMREKFLCNLVLGLHTSRQEICDKLEYFSLPLRFDAPVTVAVMRLDGYAALTSSMGEWDKQLLSFSVQNIAQETMDTHGLGLLVPMQDNEFVLLLGDRHADAIEMDLLQEIANNLQVFLSASVSIGVGHHAASLAELKYAYDNAHMAIDHRFYQGKGTIIYAQDILRDRAFEKIEFSSAFSDLYALQGRLLTQLKGGEAEQCQQHLRQMFDLLSAHATFGIAYVRCLCIEFIGTVNRLCHELEDMPEEAPLDIPAWMARVEQAERLTDIHEIMGALVTRFCAQYNERYIQRHSALVRQIYDIIDSRYMEDLTLNAIADEVFMTQNYICLVFKRETGQTINGYLTRVRMETARRLLDDTKLKVWEIAEQVGYENAHYFSTLFKKTYGMQPQQYRARD